MSGGEILRYYFLEERMSFITEKFYYNKDDLQKIFGFGRDKMKRFLEMGILPTVKVNKDYMISKADLDAWFKKNAGKTIII